jgi:hypothetical protein
MLEDMSDWASLEEAFHHGHGEGLGAGRDVEIILTAGGAFCSRMVLREEGGS